jgi:dihydrofolate reductase
VNSKLIEGDVIAGVKALKAENGPDLQVHGSANFLQSLNDAGLVDEHSIWIFPVVLGHGKRLFEDGAQPKALELTESKTSSTGVLMNRYRPKGRVVPGTFALPECSPAELARREKMKRED